MPILARFLSLCRITCGYTIHPSIEGLLPLTGIEPTPFRNSKVRSFSILQSTFTGCQLAFLKKKNPSIFPGFSKEFFKKSKDFLLLLLLTYFNLVLKSPVKNSISTKLKTYVIKITLKIAGNMVTYVS